MKKNSRSVTFLVQTSLICTDFQLVGNIRWAVDAIPDRFLDLLITLDSGNDVRCNPLANNLQGKDPKWLLCLNTDLLNATKDSRDSSNNRDAPRAAG